MSGPASYAVVVLAGGQSRRMGGGDKTALDLGAGQSVLSHLVSGLDTSVPVVVVGPSRPLERSVRWARESPPGGGPVAGLVAGLHALGDVSPDGADWVVVIAGDQPFAAAAAPLLLAARSAAVDVVLGVDGAGHDQPLLAAYRRTALTRVLADLDGAPAGRSVRSLVAALAGADASRLHRVVLPAAATLDVDDPAGLSAARAALADQPTERSLQPDLPPPH